MSNALLILERLIADKIFAAAKPVEEKLNLGQGLKALSFYLVLIGLALVLVAIFFWLQQQYNTQVATAIIGLIVLLLSGILTLVTHLTKNKKQQAIKKIGHDLKLNLDHIKASAADMLQTPINKMPLLVLASSLIAGYLVTKKYK